MDKRFRQHYVKETLSREKIGEKYKRVGVGRVLVGRVGGENVWVLEE